MLKLFYGAIVCFFAILAHAADQVKYEGFCQNGVVSAKPIGKKGPIRALTLMIQGTKTVPCAKGDEITLTGLSEVTETSHEGLKFSAVVNITPVTGPQLLILSTFQEKAFARTVPGKSV